MKHVMVVALLCLISSSLFAQTTNKSKDSGVVRKYDEMSIERNLNYSRNNYTPPGGIRNTGFYSSSVYICINGIAVEPAGKHYKNLKHYFTDCNEAMRYYKAGVRHLYANQIGLYSGLGVAAAGGIILGKDKPGTKATGTSLLAIGGGLVIAGLVEEALEQHSIKRAVKAYNTWQKNRL